MALLRLPAILGVSPEVYIILLTLGIPAFFVWRWILSKSIGPGRGRTFAVWSATIVTTPLVYAALIVGWFMAAGYYPERSFDRALWLEDRDRRYELSNDVIESTMLIGKTKEEVRQILGDEGNAKERDLWYYYLGYRPGLMNIDPDVLEVRFHDGKVVRVSRYGT